MEGNQKSVIHVVYRARFTSDTLLANQDKPHKRETVVEMNETHLVAKSSPIYRKNVTKKPYGL